MNNSKIYNNQLPKFIKKIKYFFKVFQDNKKENEEVNNIHLIYLYDTFNADYDLESIKKLTETKLLEYNHRFDTSRKIIFQFIFFDFFIFDQIITKKLERAEIIEQKDKKIEEMDKRIEEMDKRIEEKDKIIKEKDKKIQLIKKIIPKYGLIRDILADGKFDQEEKKQKNFRFI